MRQFIKSISWLAVLTGLVGCQSTHPAGGPVRLNQRLSDFERRQEAAPPRLLAADTDSMRFGDRTADAAGHGDDTRAAANRQAYAGSLSGWSGDLTLGEFEDGERTIEDGAPAEDGEYFAGAESRAADESVGFQRDPLLVSFRATLKRDLKNMGRDLWADTKRVYGNPGNLVILGITYGGAVSLRHFGPDGTLNDRYHEHRRSFGEDWRDAFATAGHPAVHFSLAGIWYLVGQRAQDEKTYEVGKTLMSALIINNLTVAFGQFATYDRSPNGETGTMPSGHTSSSFVMASVLHRAYGHAVGIPLYGLASLVGYERVDDGEHYLSDVVMGAVLGLVVGHTVAGGRDPEFFGWKVVPYANPEAGATGIAFMKTLP